MQGGVNARSVALSRILSQARRRCRSNMNAAEDRRADAHHSAIHLNSRKPLPPQSQKKHPALALLAENDHRRPRCQHWQFVPRHYLTLTTIVLQKQIKAIHYSLQRRPMGGGSAEHFLQYLANARLREPSARNPSPRKITPYHLVLLGQREIIIKQGRDCVFDARMHPCILFSTRTAVHRQPELPAAHQVRKRALKFCSSESCHDGQPSPGSQMESSGVTDLEGIVPKARG